MNLKKLYDSACSDFHHNKIDGVFVGEPNQLLETSLSNLKENCGVLAVCDLQNINDIFLSQKSFHFAKTTVENIDQIKNTILSANRLEILLIFNNLEQPVLLIEDYPEDISISLELLQINNAKLKLCT